MLRYSQTKEHRLSGRVLDTRFSEQVRISKLRNYVNLAVEGMRYGA